jgi:hypothetical protein
VAGVRVDGAEIARMGSDAASAAAHWSIEAASGDVLISVSPRSRQDFTVEFATPGGLVTP